MKKTTEIESDIAGLLTMFCGVAPVGVEFKTPENKVPSLVFFLPPTTYLFQRFIVELVSYIGENDLSFHFCLKPNQVELHVWQNQDVTTLNLRKSKGCKVGRLSSEL